MSHTITSEMTANVWKMLVKAGTHVEKGDEICILESMKMEIPVVSDVSGTVSEIHVPEGEFVKEGGALVTLDT